MKATLFIVITLLVSVISAYSQDTLRDRNNKPGTSQSLRTIDQTPQNGVQLNSNANPGQTNINRPSESNTANNTNTQTINTVPNPGVISRPDAKSPPTTNAPVHTVPQPGAVTPDATNPNTITNVPPAGMTTTTSSSATQNGISNAGKPLRKQ